MKRFLRFNHLRTPRRHPVALMVLGACAGGAIPLLAEELEPGEYNNWVTTSVGGAIVSGDRPSFQRQHQMPAGPYGGVEELHFEQMLGDAVFTLDGRAMFEMMDYFLRMGISDPNRGYVNLGFSQFRTWYDGSGGYFPPTDLWFSIFDENLYLDRGEVWVEMGLTLPDVPSIRFRYTHRYRDGKKDSLSWGDSNLTGGLGSRGIVPSFREFDETRHIFQADVRHTLGNTGVGVGLRYELGDQDNTLNIRRRPGEAQDRIITQRDIVDSDMYNVHAFTDTRFTENIWLTTGYSYTRLDTDIGGSRIYGPDYDPLYDPGFGRRQQRDEGFLDLTGGSKLHQHVMNINLMWMPLEHLFVIPSLRVERRDLDGFSQFMETNVGAPPALAPIQEDLLAMNERGWLDVSQRLEVRYSGINNVVLYARGDWLQGKGDLIEREIDLHTGAIELHRETDDDRFTQQYTVGANWYPFRNLNMGAQYYRKMRDVRYEHPIDSVPNIPVPGRDRYPALITAQDFTTDDVNFRITVRPLTGLTFVTRYDFQISTIDTEKEFLPKIESGKWTSHIFSETVTWMPIARLYLQGSLSYAIDRVDSGIRNMPEEVSLLVPKSRNDYWNASLSAGYALSEKTDLHANYIFYRASNYTNNSLVSQPYGADHTQHGTTLGVTHRFKPNLRGMLRYGYYTFKDRTSGNHNNFDAHLIYTGLQYRF
jgi:hypothetical protein